MNHDPTLRPDLPGRLRDGSLRVVDGSLAAVLLAAPLFFGGRHGLGLLVYTAIVAVAAAAWLAHQTLSPWPAPPVHRWALGLLTAAGCLVGLQLLPLPPELFAALSPGLAEQLPLWTGSAGSPLPAWRTLSAEPWSTRISLATLLTHVVLFLTVAARVRSVDDARRVVRLIAVAGVAMAVLALLQFASRTEELLGFYPLAFREVSQAALGSFTTPNHCGHFLALSASAVLFCLLESQHALAGTSHATPRRRGAVERFSKEQLRVLLWALGLASICLAVLLTFSRGGALSLIIALAVGVVLLARAGWIGRRQLGQAALAALVALIALSATSYDHAAQSMGGLSSSGVEELADTSNRHPIWEANLTAFAASPWLGYGAGSHAAVYRMFMTAPSTVLYTHAESGYLQVATETGAVGAVLLVAALALAGGWCVQGVVGQSPRVEWAVWAVVAAALVASAAHSIADFVWYIPSCLAPVVMLTAVAERLTTLRTAGEPNEQSVRPSLGIATRCACVLASAVSVAVLFGPGLAATHRDKYDAASVALKRYSTSLFAGTASSDDPDVEQRTHQSQLFYVDEMLGHLTKAAAADPHNPHTQLRLARLSIQKFALLQAMADNSLGLDAIRQAALAAQFESPQALRDWLDRAYGEQSQLLYSALSHAHSAVLGSPLVGEGYLQLADLAFLCSSREQLPSELVSQAMLVRPYDGQVLFESGRHRYYAGQIEQAMELWRRSAHRPGSHRVRLAGAAASLFPAEEFIEQFQPDWELTQLAFKQYQQRGGEADLRALSRHAMVQAQIATTTEKPTRAAQRWLQASAIQLSLGEVESGVECALHAHRLDPNRLPIRLGLANALFKAERYEEADPHVRWCLARRPDDQGLRHRLERIAKQRSTSRHNGGEVRTALWSPGLFTAAEQSAETKQESVAEE